METPDGDASPVDAGYQGRARPHSMFQDSGSDIRMRRLQAAGVTAVDPASESGPVTLRSADPMQPCASCAFGGDGAIVFDGIDEALLAVAFAQWRAQRAQLPGCNCQLGQLLWQQRPRLAAYMQELRALLPASAAEWASAGVLYRC